MKKQFSLLLFLIIGVFGFAQECGTLMTPLSIQERSNEATHIIEGKVMASNAYWDVNKHNIYTVHTITAYKSFKGQSNVTFKVVTVGGKVDDHFQRTSSSANLQPGMVGTFFMKSFRGQIAVTESLYELVGAAQGVVKYDKFTGKASDIFNKYSSLDGELYPSIRRATGNKERILQARPLQNRTMAMRANPIIYSFSPLTATAGTQTVLTITGTNFGSTMGTMSFSNANDGGATFTPAADAEILSWSNTVIEVQIPYLAGTGAIRITHSDGSTHDTSVPLTITYSHNNLDNSGTILALALQDDDGNGGYTFAYHTDFNSSSAKTYFEEAFGLWNCESNINFSFGNTTTTDESVSDGINIVRFDNGSELASGVLGSVTTRFTTYCGTTNRVLVDEMDITWNDDTNWHYGSGVPSASEYDFKTVALHELGHAHQLGHVIDSDVIMHYSLGAGDEKYVLDQNDIDGAVYTMDIFTESIGCGNTAMSESIQCCDAISISSQPSDLELAEGATGQFSVNASNYIDALWFSSSDGNSWSVLSDGTDYSGTTTTTLTINSANLSDNNKFFRVFLENECGEFINSDNATLTVIEYTTIPDSNFEAALEALGYDDISGDGQVPTDSINTITSLNVDGESINDLTGIEDFVALETLDADNNSLTTIDVTNLTNLRQLSLQYNSLTSLDVTNNSNLEALSFRNNSVTAIDLSNNVNLLSLGFQYNSITDIDLSNNILLYHIACRDNGLTSLDLTNNPEMINIYAQNNSIPVVDLSGNPDLAIVAFPNNDIVEFNIKNGNNTNITAFNNTGNSSLECILVDDADYSSTNWTQIDATVSFSDTAYCKYTAIPDANFEATLETLGYDDISDDGQVPTSLIENVTSLNVSNLNISDLTGIEDFTALEELTITNNSLTSLDVTNNLALETIFAGNNNLTSIDVSNNTQLTRLWLQDNNLSTIDISNNPLLFAFSVGGNSLITIADISNNTALESLYLNDTAITTLDLSNHPQLTTLGLSNTNLNSLNLQNGNNTNLTTLFLTENPNLYCIIVDDADYSNTNWSGNIDSGTSFTETGYCEYTAIPDANFEAALEAQNYDDISSDGQVPTALIEGITNLSIDNEGITDLTGIEDFAALTELVISDNNIVTLDVSNNPNLTRLEAFSCGFTSLDISQNTNLEELIVYSNALTTLDTSNNTSLTNVTLFANKISSLDFTSNTALTYVEVSDNELTELNIQNGTNNLIQTFDATNNSNLSCIIVDDAADSTMNWTIDSNTSFSETYCRYTTIPDANFETRLESIIADDVSGDGQVPTALIEVITNLNLANRSIADLTGIEDFTALQKLNASTNNLTSVDLTNNTNLEELNISDNVNLTSLNVSSCVLLERIKAEDNAFSTLDLSANTQLDALFVTDNDALTEIDLSTNSLLRVLTLDNLDNIASVDVSQNVLMDSLQVTNNVILSEFNVKNGANTDVISFQGNNNSSLTCILVDDASYSTSSWSTIDSQASFSDTYCRYTAIPDANFETALEALITDDVSGDGQVPTAEIETLTNLDVSSLNISDLTGIEDFVALETLYCSNNNLTTINVSNLTNLQSLRALSNDLTTIDLTNNTALTDLRIEQNNLTSIDLTNQSNLVFLQIDRNELTALDVSNSPSITRFRAYNNHISTIDLSNNSLLREVRVSGNELLSLNVQNGNNTNINIFVANGNEFLDCILVDDASYSATNWTSIDSQTTFNETECIVAYTAIPDTIFEATLESLGYDDISGDNQVPTVYIEGVTSLDVSSLGVSDLTGIEDFIALVDLDAEVNNLTSLDLSNNLLLETVDLDSNELATLTLPTNGSLVTFICNNNPNLTTIDFSGNTNLETIQCGSNGLTSVNLNGLSMLNSLALSSNSLSTIDVSSVTNLATFVIANNTLTSIDLSNNTNLTYLNIESNNLNSLDISNNTALEYLFFSDNSIASIDVSSQTALLWLYTSNNLLTTIDVSSNTLLQKLWVNDNQLTSLDIVANTVLEELVCYNNTITTLDASANTALEWFLVNDNALVSVNIQNGNNTNINNFASYNNPDLTCVLVDEASYSTTNWTLVDGTLSFSETACTTDYTIAIDVFLQGAALNPNTGEENLMRDDLRVAGLIPTTSPYTDGLTCDATVFDTTGNDAIVDWVLVELRDATDNTMVTYSQSALLQRDGDVVDVDGTSDLVFSLEDGTNYVAVQHRNHLGVMTVTAATLSSGPINNINFTDANTEITYGTNAQTTSGMPDDVLAMWAGDCNEDNNVQYSGTSPDTPDILSAVLNDAGNFLNFPTYSITGYNTNDVNMDGIIQYSGTNPDTPFVLQNVLAHPSNFLGFSTYQINGQAPENTSNE
ncbi:matrixin family metalloprotease [uncultured Kordia sp.]|uniref:matrixin family metalloprotease n=1 Tax=uncultured Kordia sp. TaxID=507699 RepID=UPI00261910D6|nr:matrixin family metalloprotease [uncultured Kordia sp.]